MRYVEHHLTGTGLTQPTNIPTVLGRKLYPDQPTEGTTA